MMRMFLVALIVALFFRQNNPPTIKITLPKANESFVAGAPIRYSISVSDEEDGDTKFDEINSNEILLTVSTSGAKPKNKETLHAMMKSNCMQCHAFNSKLIGPSFRDISEKKSNAADLVKHVKEGSGGIWGGTVMPSHPELENEEIQKMVDWILKFRDEKSVEYYLGKEGSIKVQQPSSIMLSASYVDHNQSMGEDAVTITVK